MFRLLDDCYAEGCCSSWLDGASGFGSGSGCLAGRWAHVGLLGFGAAPRGQCVVASAARLHRSPVLGFGRCLAVVDGIFAGLAVTVHGARHGGVLVCRLGAGSCPLMPIRVCWAPGSPTRW